MLRGCGVHVSIPYTILGEWFNLIQLNLIYHRYFHYHFRNFLYYFDLHCTIIAHHLLFTILSFIDQLPLLFFLFFASSLFIMTSIAIAPTISYTASHIHPLVLLLRTTQILLTDPWLVITPLLTEVRPHYISQYGQTV